MKHFLPSEPGPGYWAEPAEHLNSFVMFVLTKLRYHIVNVKRPTIFSK